MEGRFASVTPFLEGFRFDGIAEALSGDETFHALDGGAAEGIAMPLKRNCFEWCNVGREPRSLVAGVRCIRYIFFSQVVQAVWATS